MLILSHHINYVRNVQQRVKLISTFSFPCSPAVPAQPYHIDTHHSSPFTSITGFETESMRQLSLLLQGDLLKQKMNRNVSVCCLFIALQSKATVKT